MDDEIDVSENTISVGHVVRQEQFRGNNAEIDSAIFVGKNTKQFALKMSLLYAVVWFRSSVLSLSCSLLILLHAGIRTFLTGTQPDETGMRGGESDGSGSFRNAEIVQPSLTSLNLTGCKIRSHGMTEIAVAIRKNERLKTLYLSDNWCEDQGATVRDSESQKSAT